MSKDSHTLALSNADGSDSPEQQVAFYKELAERRRLEFVMLTWHLLPKLLSKRINDIDVPFKSADWNTTEDGTLFPYLVFEEPDGPFLERQRWSGYICPHCASENVKKLTSQVESSGKDFTIWLEGWECRDCQRRWKYKNIWQD